MDQIGIVLPSGSTGRVNHSPVPVRRVYLRIHLGHGGCRPKALCRSPPLLPTTPKAVRDVRSGEKGADGIQIRETILQTAKETVGTLPFPPHRQIADPGPTNDQP